jgi:hypothetical protein
MFKICIIPLFAKLNFFKSLFQLNIFQKPKWNSANAML